MNRLSNPVKLLLAAAFVSAMVLAPGCEKKKPPPPPPKIEEPPAPVEVSFDSIMQTLKADSRVKAAGSLGITDESFAQAAVKLADAMAKGDADKLKEMLTLRAKNVVDGLVADGEWSKMSPRIEEVRIVYAGTSGSASELERQQGIAQMKAMMPGRLTSIENMLDKRGVDKNEKARILAEAKRKMEEEFNNLQFEKALDAIKNGDTATPSDAPAMAMLLAVQTPDGAELLGWTAQKGGDKWVFNNASTLAVARAKAADWDGVGMFGFSLGTGQAPVEAKPAAGAGGGGSGGGGNSGGGGGGGAPSGGSPSPSPDKPNLPNRDPRKLVPGGGG